MGFGGAFSSENALNNYQNTVNLQGAAMEQASANQAAAIEREQANAVYANTLQQAQAKQRDVALTAANQAEQYLSAGILMAGTPAAVVNDTVTLGQQEVDNIMRAGTAQRDLLRLEADQYQEQGFASVLGAENQNFTNTQQLKIKQQQEKQQMFDSLFLGPLTRFGIGLLSR